MYVFALRTGQHMSMLDHPRLWYTDKQTVNKQRISKKSSKSRSYLHPSQQQHHQAGTIFHEGYAFG